MTKQDTIGRLLDPGVIAIVRAKEPVDLAEVAEALYAGGVRAIEATMTTPAALESIQGLPKEILSRVVVGVGTVLDSAAARRAVEAGAQFVVTPVVRLDVVRTCIEMGVPVACGAFSPTEAMTAHESGADFVKLYPADALGPAYVKALLAPMPMLRIVPTGGITPETCGAFLKAGCVAVGAGSRLVSEEILAARDWPKLTERAREFVAAVNAARLP